MEEAVRSGNLERVRELIQDGMDVNACFKGLPLLCLAIKMSHNRVALELIDRGANVHAKDATRGRTALHWACKDRGREKVVKRLIDQGSSVNEEDNKGKTPIQLAARWGGKHGLANCLLRAGANCQVLSARQKNLLVRYACLEGDVYVVQTLITNGCDINTTYVKGNTLLMQAVEEDHEDLVKMLLLEGAKLDLQDSDGCTALHYAALNDHIQCGVLLAEGGANVGIKDKHSDTALDVARSKEFKEAVTQAVSFTVSKIVCIIGNTGVGKSTLIAALQAESNSFFGKAINRFWWVSDHRKRTAGIENIHHVSQRYGKALFFDFAGQNEFYDSHQAFLESFLSKPGVSLTFLLVVKATDKKEAILDQLHYWLFPLAQMSANATISPQIVVIGSFLDQVKSKDEAASILSKCINETRDVISLKVMGSCMLNCRQPQSEGIDNLCHFLKMVPIPKLKATDTQYSLAWVLSQIRSAYKDQMAVQVHKLATWMQENRDNLPPTIPPPEEVCKDLSAAGHALYLPNKNRSNDGWLVLDFGSSLHNFYSALFSEPKENINRFGLRYCQELVQLFPQMSSEMVQQILITLELCTPVNPTVLSDDVPMLTASREDSGWLFFPTFVSAEPPKVPTIHHPPQRICSLWWQLKTSGKHFFFARVLQTILLRLLAHFVMRQDRAGGVQGHCCSFWKNSISWHSKEGIAVTVHITNTVINVVGVGKETDDGLFQYLTDVIPDILSTVRQISPNLKADAYIVHRPMRMAVFSKDFIAPSCKELFSVTEIETSIKACSEHILPVAGGDRHSSTVFVTDLFGGRTPSLEDIGKILWVQRDPIWPQLAAAVNAEVSVNPSRIIPTQLSHLNHPTFAFVSNPVLLWSLKIIYNH